MAGLMGCYSADQLNVVPVQIGSIAFVEFSYLTGGLKLFIQFYFFTWNSVLQRCNTGRCTQLPHRIYSAPKTIFKAVAFNQPIEMQFQLYWDPEKKVRAKKPSWAYGPGVEILERCVPYKQKLKKNNM